MLFKIYIDFIFAIKTVIMIKDNFDYYKHIYASFYFGKLYYTLGIKKKHQNLDLLIALKFYLVKNIGTFFMF